MHRFVIIFLFLWPWALLAQHGVCHRDLPAVLAPAPGLRAYHVEHYDLTIIPDYSLRHNPSLRGSVNIRLIASDTLQQIELDCSQAISIDSLDYNGEAEFAAEHAGNKLIVKLLSPMYPQQQATITIFYRATPPQSGGVFYFREHNGDTLLWTLSEPYGAREWWPCRQDLGDKADSVTVRISLPAQSDFIGVSNGLLQKIETAAGLRTYTYTHRYPIAPYLVGVAAAPYIQFDTLYQGKLGTFPIHDYAYPWDAQKADDGQKQTTELLGLFEEIFGPYPWSREQYGHAQFTRGGGMEHQTISFVINWGFDLIAHELAHQWFGDYITCASWNTIWINEGFATYSEYLAYEKLKPEGALPWLLESRKVALRAEVNSVYVPDTTSIPRIFDNERTYEKGAQLLHMLRNLIGDEAFYAGLKNYASDPRLAFGFATPFDFQQHMEKAGDTSLSRFFADWYYGEGFPVYDITARPEGDEWKIEIQQNNSSGNGHVMDMPLELLFFSRGDTFKTAVRPNAPSNVFYVSVPLRPSGIVADPEYKVLSKNTVKFIKVDEQEQFTVFIEGNGRELTIINGELHPAERIIIVDALGREMGHFEDISPGQRLNFDLRSVSRGLIFMVGQEKNGLLTRKTLWIN